MSGRARRVLGLDVWAVLVAAVFVMVGIGLPLIGLKVFAGTDLLLSKAPWSAAAPTGFIPQVPCVTDTVDSALPVTEEFKTRLAHGDFAKWDPYATGGSPLASVPSPAVLSPLSAPYLIMPLWMAPAFVKLLEMIVSIGGMFLFLRRVGVGRPAAVLGGLIFTSSGFMVVWTNWPQTRVAAFLPALFWAVERVVQRRRPIDVALIAAVLASMLFGGFPALVGYAVYAAAPYLVLRLVIEHRRARPVLAGAALAGIGLLLGVGLTALQLLPFVHELSGLDLGYRAQTPDLHLSVSGLLTTFVPGAFGTCDNGVYYGPWNSTETISFLGVTAVLLCVVGVVARRGRDASRGLRGFLVAGLAATLVLGWLGGPPLALVQHLPIFSNNHIGRIRVLLGFFAAALAALGYDALLRGVHPDRVSRGRRALAAGVWLAVAAMIGVVVWRAVKFVQPINEVAALRHSAKLPLVVGVLAVVAVVFAAYRWPVGRRVALVALPLLVLVESLAFVLPFWPRTDRADFYPRTPAHGFLADNLGHDRFGAEALTMYPATGPYYGLRTVTGHTFTESAWADLLTAVDPGVFLTPTFTKFDGAASPTTALSPVLDRLAVRYFVFDPGAKPIGTEASIGAAAGQVSLLDGQSVEVKVPAQALRGVGPVLAAAVAQPAAPFARIDVQVLSQNGAALAQSSRRLFTGVGGSAPFYVALPGENLAAAGGPVRVRLTLHSAGGRISIATTKAGTPVLAVVRPKADLLRLVFADDGAVIYQRLAALPRIRWASTATVIADPAAQVAAMKRGLPGDTVVLGAPPAGGGAAGPPAAAAPAASAAAPRVEVPEDSGDTIRSQVTAPAAGYLVVADALQSGWTATVDGRPAALLPAEHAVVAVAVPAGTHDIVLSYAPAGYLAGKLISIVAGILLVGLLGYEAVRRRRGGSTRPPDGQRPADTAAAPAPDAPLFAGGALAGTAPTEAPRSRRPLSRRPSPEPAATGAVRAAASRTGRHHRPDEDSNP